MFKRGLIFVLCLCLFGILCACNTEQTPVQIKPSAILFSHKTVELKIGEQFQQRYTFVPEDATAELSWQSANEEVATVDNEGNILAVSPGMATIVCSTSEGIMDTCEVLVRKPTAIDLLNDDETLLYNCLIEQFLPSMINPATVRIQKIEFIRAEGETENYEKEINLWLNIQRANTVGGAVTEEYWTIYDKEKDSWFAARNGDGVTYDLFKEEAQQLDPEKINAALSVYWSGNP